MIRILVLSLFSGMLFLTACSKKNTVAATTVEVTVTDGIDGTPMSKAVVYLYANAADVATGNARYTQLADATGKAKITVTYASQYFVVAQYNGLRSYFNGLLPIAVFKSQADIDNSPLQIPAGAINEPKFQDTNGDGVITSADDVAPPAVTISANANTAYSTTVY